MNNIHSSKQTLQAFRVQTDMLKARYGSYSNSRDLQLSNKSTFEFLIGTRTHAQEFYLQDGTLLDYAVQLAQLDGRQLFAELERIRQWSGRCDFVIRPVIHRFMNQSKVRELASILEQVPGAAKNTGNELANAKTALEVILGLLEFL